MKDKYKPIDCGIYDHFEMNAILKKKIYFEYLDENQNIQTISSIIKTLKTQNKEEFMILENGLEIRLDKIKKWKVLS